MNRSNIPRFPFDIHAPMGYTVAWLVQLLNMFCMADIVLASPLLFTGVCMFSEDLVSDIEINLKRFEAKVIAPNKEQRVHKLASELIDILRFHARAKQLVSGIRLKSWNLCDFRSFFQVHWGFRWNISLHNLWGAIISHNNALLSTSHVQHGELLSR